MNQTSSSKKYIKNTSWILIEKMSRIISGILVGVLVARYLGPDQFGLISYALNVVAIFTIFSTLGLDSIVVRELITRNEYKNNILGTTFWMRLVGACVVVVAATAYSSVRDNHQQTFIVFLVSISIILQSFTVVDFYFQSKVLGKLTAINQVITLLLSSIVKIFFIYIKAPLEYFAAMVLFEATLTAINQYLFFKSRGENVFDWKFSFNEAKELLSHSWPIIISGLMMMVYQKMDQILIKRFLDLSMVGNYSAAVRMSEASYFIPVAICAAVFPGIVNARNNKELQTKRLTQLYSILIWSALTVSIGGFIFGDWVINFLYKEKFALAAPVFKIHIWSTIPIFFSTAWGVWMLAENKQKMIIYLQVISLVCCFFLHINLIPRLGITGAAWSVIITYYIGLLAVLFIYKPKLNITLFLSAFNPKHLLDIYKYYKNDKQHS
jgi:O-antigen/teichoic acid export membrane protein